MTISPWLIYLVLRLDSIKFFMGFIGFFLIIVGIATFISCVSMIDMYSNDRYDSEKTKRVKALKRRYWKKILIIPIIFTLLMVLMFVLNIFIPTKQEAVKILGLPNQLIEVNKSR